MASITSNHIDLFSLIHSLTVIASVIRDHTGLFSLIHSIARINSTPRTIHARTEGRMITITVGIIISVLLSVLH